VNGSGRDKPGAPESSSHLQNQTLFAIMRVEPESRQASRQKSLAGPVAVQAELQEYFVFVRPRNRVDRREREQPEPAVHVRRKIVRVCLRRAVHPASKPFGRETKSNSFGEARIPPLFPESVVTRRAIQKKRELIHMQDSQASAKEMPNRMPARIAERIRRMQRRQTNTITICDAPTFPEAFRPVRLESK